MKAILTDRLKLRELTLNDAPFILELVNQPSWIENIGDKQVHNLADAKNYLLNGPIKSYQVNGYGLNLVELRLKGYPVGLCGLIKRDFFDAPDIGFAFMPEYWGMGLASEAGKATREFAREQLNIEQIVGFTAVDNSASMRVLEKIGLRYDKVVDLPGYSEPSRLFISH